MKGYGRAWRYRVRMRRHVMRHFGRCWRGHHVAPDWRHCPECGAQT